MWIETICIIKAEVMNLSRHIERMRRTASHFGFNAPALPNLTSLLAKEILESRSAVDKGNTLQHTYPSETTCSKIKCRIKYHKTIEEITFAEYHPKKINSLKIVEASFDYSFKYADRSSLNALSSLKGNCDELLITRNGIITDTSYSNIVFSQGNQYFTPQHPLLNGTKRQKLLQEGVIFEKNIHRDTLHQYDRVYLINAMLDIEDNNSLPISNIY